MCVQMHYQKKVVVKLASLNRHESIFGIVCKMETRSSKTKNGPKLSHQRTAPRSCEIRCILKLVSCHEISISKTEKKAENEDAERTDFLTFSLSFLHKREWKKIMMA